MRWLLVIGYCILFVGCMTDYESYNEDTWERIVVYPT